MNTTQLPSQCHTTRFATTIALVMMLWFSSTSPAAAAADTFKETAKQHNARMKWWRDARFGMFIHWGLYAIPAGEWKGKTNHAEWIRHTARIPVKEYEKFVKQFNPVKFDADRWVLRAKRAGMKYIVITSKHHDGFCLWDTKQTDFSVMSTPFKRDILGELTAACKRHGIRMCFYYSIMDWHHPDYLPRRSWEVKDRPVDGADFSRYISYLKSELTEIIKNYDPGVLWFDGEWEKTWTHKRGQDLCKFVRGLKPDIIINNRVDKGRSGMQGFTKEGGYSGDFGTPEQEIPDQGLPGVDWESCMTMNNHWGWNKNDKNWKSTTDLVRKLIDIASKGGNFLLNIGPKADGTFPEAAIERLDEIGKWMDTYGDSIYGTHASPFEKPAWGRITQKKLDGGKTRLYLNVFDRPSNGKITLEGLANKTVKAFMLNNKKPLKVSRSENIVTISLPAELPNKIASVIALDVEGKPRIVTINPYEHETPKQHDARMKWWRNARFGMFIHWGVYSVPAGTYKGKRIRGIGEWIMNRGKIPVKEYKAFARQFNPVKYDPAAWVQMAKDAGMKYMVITSKHHDGFALFDSKSTDWDVVDATPYGKDLLKPLSEACHKNGIKLGFYYSQAQDWNHPGGAAAGGHWDKAQDGSMDNYIRTIAVPEVREILSNYGKIAILWWDTPYNMNRERAGMLLPLIRLQPGIITNNRLGGGFPGDFSTPEQHIPATGISGRDWETCMTMNDTWGYKSYDNNWKSSKMLIRNLIDIASKGGNYLLNVGPTSLGEFPPPIIERLKAIGKWMHVNGKAIYSTTANPFEHLAWGRCTKRVHPGGVTLYLHVFDWPSDGKLLVPGLRNKILSAGFLADETAPGKKSASTSSAKNESTHKITATQVEDGVLLSVPAKPLDSVATVIVLEIKGKVKIEKLPLHQDSRGSLLMPAVRVLIHNAGGGQPPKIETKYGAPNIGFWLDAGDWISWKFKINKPGLFDIAADLASTDPTTFKLVAAGKKITVNSPSTGDYGKFKVVTLGQVTIKKPGTYTLEMHPVRKTWKPLNIRSILLKPSR